MGAIAFIIGSARSGTTVLGQILGCHPQIMQWYEPYYLWRRYFLCKESEEWLPEEFNEKTKWAIQREHRIFQKKAKKALVVEKMPSHSYNVKYVHRIFPDAKWIHIIRDGRDVVLSMKKEWEKRRRIIEEKDYSASLKTALRVLKRPPFLRYKLMLLLYELKSNFSLSPAKYLNKAKWKGTTGWGPRFSGWEDFLEAHSPLEFNAMQWVKTVEAVIRDWHILSGDHKIELRYEELLTYPEKTLQRLLDFLAVEAASKFFDTIPQLKDRNFNKWEKELTAEEITLIEPIQHHLLVKLGYAP